jgi:hypothetical protein
VNEIQKQGLCFNCFRQGHKAVDCTAPKKRYQP